MSNTPHHHWSHYDEELEMKSFNDLQVRLSEARDATKQSSTLIELAQSSGYGDADSHLCDKAGREEETEETAAHDEIYANFSDNDYFRCIDESETILAHALSDPTAVKAARDACDGMREAYQRGRTMRESLDADESPKP